MQLNRLYNMDCMDGMKPFPDKYFDLAIVDPPYGCEVNNDRIERTGGTWSKKYGKRIKQWDIAPSCEYFDELFRVSKNQIIWGGNYFRLPPTRCFLIWRKLTISESFSMAMCEYAWTSLTRNAKLFEYAPQDKNRFHPTQKPVALYRWLLSHYAKKGDIILDTHAGSAASLVAAWEAGLSYVGFEVDSDYFSKAQARLDTVQEQGRLLFDSEPLIADVQKGIFS